jgi:hypothetical protein
MKTGVVECAWFEERELTSEDQLLTFVRVRKLHLQTSARDGPLVRGSAACPNLFTANKEKFLTRRYLESKQDLAHNSPSTQHPVPRAWELLLTRDPVLELFIFFI